MTIKEIDQLIEEGESLRQIAQAYSEIANQKIKRIRAQLEINRLFFQEIFRVYGLVKALAEKKGVVIKKPKKSLSIILTSNFRFYGKINSALIDYFVENTKNLPTDRLIVGKAALDYFKSVNVFKNYHEIIFTKDQPDFSEMTNLVNIIKDYQQVLVFYSKLKSLLVQNPTVTDITASSQKVILDGGQNTHFIFEPELPQILAFFDSQIITLLVDETFLESEVGRTASRFITMDQAETASIKMIKEYQMLRSYAQSNLQSNQLLESIAAILAVRKAT